MVGFRCEAPPAGAWVMALLAACVIAHAAAAMDECAPCLDAARSRVEYRATLGLASRDLVARAVGRGGVEAKAAFLAHCTLDTTTFTPRAYCVANGADTIRAWRAAVAKFGASSGAMSDSGGRVGIATLAALDRALRRPDQPITRVRGWLKQTERGAELVGCEPTVHVTGPGADSLASGPGADVWVQGYCRGADSLEWLGGHAMGRDRIDLFVMGNCPFAHRLEAQMVHDMAKLAPADLPEIAVHYLLHWEDDGMVRRAGSAHGEAERREDAVQILIRDHYPMLFWRYLELRSKADVSWELLAKRAGLDWPAITAIRNQVAGGLDDVLMVEHMFNAANFPRVGGSPTVFWRGLQVASIAEVPGFTAPVNEKEKCEGSGPEETPTR